MANFLEETIRNIKAAGKTVDDIIFIGSLESGYACKGWDHFKDISNFEYDDGFGSAKIATDLVVVFSDYSHFRREEYDGSERWEYIPFIKIPSKTKEVKKLGGDQYMWETLEEMNKEKTDD